MFVHSRIAPEQFAACPTTRIVDVFRRFRIDRLHEEHPFVGQFHHLEYVHTLFDAQVHVPLQIQRPCPTRNEVVRSLRNYFRNRCCLQTVAQLVSVNNISVWRFVARQQVRFVSMAAFGVNSNANHLIPWRYRVRPQDCRSCRRHLRPRCICPSSRQSRRSAPSGFSHLDRVRFLP